MSKRYLDILTQVVRKPRHAATGEATLRVELLRGDETFVDDDAPQIVDFSRGGCKLRWTEALLDGEVIVIRLCDTANGLCLDIPARVRWSRPTPPELFSSGCRFDRELDYEQLGELFLAGFLSTEEVPV